jgi:hypothetical protein
MKTILFIVLLNPLMLLYGQSVTMVNKLSETLTLYVDGKATDSFTSVSIGNHNLIAKYSDNSVAAEQNVNFPPGFSYTWDINPPAVQILIKRTAKKVAPNKTIRCTQGELYVNGEYFCKTMELPFDNDKNFYSSIAVGKYEANIISTQKHPGGVIALKNVKSYVYHLNENGEWKKELVDRNINGYVEIHSGNWPYEMQGCILVGKTFDSTDDCTIRGGLEIIKELYSTYFDTDIDDNPNKNVNVTVEIRLGYN